MNFVEFDYTTEDGLLVIVEGQGKLVFESNYGADHEDHKGYPVLYVTNIKYKCLNHDGTMLSKSMLSEDDQIIIEEKITNALTLAGEDPETVSDFYERFD